MDTAARLKELCDLIETASRNLNDLEAERDTLLIAWAKDEAKRLNLSIGDEIKFPGRRYIITITGFSASIHPLGICLIVDGRDQKGRRHLTAITQYTKFERK